MDTFFRVFKMLFLLMALGITFHFGQILACDDTLKAYPLECELQDRYQKVKAQFQEKFQINVEDLTLYKALRIIARKDIKISSKGNGILPWEIYGPAPTTWLLWERGTRHLKSMDMKLTVESLKELHQKVINDELIGMSSRILLGASPGYLRNQFYHLPPSYIFNCQDGINKEKHDLLQDFDIKDKKGNPFIYGHLIPCGDGLHYRGFVRYLSSPAVLEEMENLVQRFQKGWKNFQEGAASAQSPLEFIADIQRTYVAIHPFREGNGRLSRLIQDLFLENLGLPFIPAGDLTDDILSGPEEYRENTKREMSNNMDFLEDCLIQYENHAKNKSLPIREGCSPLYALHDSKEDQAISKEKVAFHRKLEEFLNPQILLPQNLCHDQGSWNPIGFPRFF